MVAAAPPPEPEKRPVWSDHGDAPFEDTESTPVYARKGKGSSSGGSGNEFFEILKTVAFALLIALVLRIVLFQPFTIPSASMEPNLYEGDYIVVSKWSYGYSRHSIPWSPPLFKGRILANQPERGDIVVFKLPRDAGQGPNQTDYIKRLIGLPGDRVQMINNVLYLNGTIVPDVVTSRNEVDEVGHTVIKFNETLPGGKTFKAQEWGPGNPLDNTAEFTVPAGYYLMIGDNRDNSLDSREYPENGGVGLVPAENLVGKAEIILFSWHPGASLFNPVSWFSKVRPSRFFTVLN
ncbi:MAG TPA: signal peptidase I [Brevundimonas sp.]